MPSERLTFKARPPRELWLDLPPNLGYEICKHLTQEDIGQARATCHAWKRLFTEHISDCFHFIYDEGEDGCIRSLVNFEAIFPCFESLNITVAGKPFQTPELDLNHIMPEAQAMTTLRTLRMKLKTDNYLDCGDFFDCFPRAIFSCNQLTHLDFKLQADFDGDALQEMSSMAGLQHLCMRIIPTSMKDAEVCKLDQVTPMLSLRQLRHLDCSMKMDSSSWRTWLQQLPTALQQLTSLRLRRELTANVVKNANLSRLAHLQVLSLTIRTRMQPRDEEDSSDSDNDSGHADASASGADVDEYDQQGRFLPCDAGLSSLMQLRSLLVEAIPMHDRMWTAICALTQLTQLHVAHDSGSLAESSVYVVAPGSMHFAALSDLQLKLCHVHDGGSWARQRGLHDLELSNVTSTQRLRRALHGAHVPSLPLLEVDWSALCAAPAVRSCCVLPGLPSADVAPRQASITDADCGRIAASWKHLSKLEFEGRLEMTAVGWQILNGLRSLRQLRLANDCLGGPELPLAQLSTGITSLHLSYVELVAQEDVRRLLPIGDEACTPVAVPPAARALMDSAMELQGCAARRPPLAKGGQLRVLSVEHVAACEPPRSHMRLRSKAVAAVETLAGGDDDCVQPDSGRRGGAVANANVVEWRRAGSGPAGSQIQQQASGPAAARGASVWLGRLRRRSTDAGAGAAGAAASAAPTAAPQPRYNLCHNRAQRLEGAEPPFSTAACAQLPLPAAAGAEAPVPLCKRAKASAQDDPPSAPRLMKRPFTRSQAHASEGRLASAGGPAVAAEAVAAAAVGAMVAVAASTSGSKGMIEDRQSQQQRNATPLAAAIADRESRELQELQLLRRLQQQQRDAAPFQQLYKVRLVNCRVRWQGADPVANNGLLPPPQLPHKQASIGPVLQMAPWLQELHLVNCDVCDADLELVAAESRCLRQLRVHETDPADRHLPRRNCARVSSIGVCALALLPRLRHLQLLLPDQAVNDKGVAGLTALVTLRSLELWFNSHIAGWGYAELSQLEGLRSLVVIESRLSHRGTASYEAVDALDEQMPWCHVSRRTEEEQLMFHEVMPDE